MALQKNRKSKSRTSKKRSQFLKSVMPPLNRCPGCAAYTLSHCACLSCGLYRGRIIFGIKK